MTRPRNGPVGEITPSNHPAEGPVVAVVDGSGSSRAAALWAAREAKRRSRPLKLVHAYTIPVPLSLPGILMPPPNIGAEIRSWAETVLAAVESAVRDKIPELSVESLVVEGDAGEALRDASNGSVLTVVGSTGYGEFSGTVLGSVALYLSVHAHGPVIVVRGDRDAVAAESGPVLVCVDGSIDPEGLLPFAFEQASLLGRPLVAVHTFTEMLPPPVMFAYARQIRQVRTDDETDRLASWLAAWSGRFPDVEIQPLVLRGRTAVAVLEHIGTLPAPDRPSLIVVGTRGLGGVAGMVFGSTSHTLMTHAPCPVAVVPNAVDRR